MASYSGLRGWPEYSVWYGMIDRCTSPGSPSYSNYGGRGITVCDEWKGRGGFKRFIEHVGRRPGTSREYQLDRIENDGNYEPGNVRWASKREQSLKTRRSRRFEWQGQLLTVRELADLAGVNYFAMHQRLTRMHWSVDRAMAEPLQRQST